MSLSDITAAAREHAIHLREDIENAGSRGEHIRLTRLALEADRLATELETWNGEV